MAKPKTEKKMLNLCLELNIAEIESMVEKYLIEHLGDDIELNCIEIHAEKFTPCPTEDNESPRAYLDHDTKFGIYVDYYREVKSK